MKIAIPTKAKIVALTNTAISNATAVFVAGPNTATVNRMMISATEIINKKTINRSLEVSLSILFPPYYNGTDCKLLLILPINMSITVLYHKKTKLSTLIADLHHLWYHTRVKQSVSHFKSIGGSINVL